MAGVVSAVVLRRGNREIDEELAKAAGKHIERERLKAEYRAELAVDAKRVELAGFALDGAIDEDQGNINRSDASVSRMVNEYIGLVRHRDEYIDKAEEMVAAGVAERVGGVYEAESSGVTPENRADYEALVSELNQLIAAGPDRDEYIALAEEMVAAGTAQRVVARYEVDPVGADASFHPELEEHVSELNRLIEQRHQVVVKMKDYIRNTTGIDTADLVNALKSGYLHEVQSDKIPDQGNQHELLTFVEEPDLIERGDGLDPAYVRELARRAGMRRLPGERGRVRSAISSANPVNRIFRRNRVTQPGTAGQPAPVRSARANGQRNPDPGRRAGGTRGT